MNHVKNNRPVLLLDQDKGRYGSSDISAMIRFISGSPVKYLGKAGDLDLKPASLGKYSAIICAGRFTLESHGIINRDLTTGRGLLQNHVSPAINKLPKDKKPLLVYISSDNREQETASLKASGILSFNRTDDSVLIGLALRLYKQFGLKLDREMLLKRVIGETANTYFLNRELTRECNHYIEPWIWDEPAGEGVNLSWDQVVEMFGSALRINPKEFEGRIKAFLPNGRGVENK